LECGRGNIVLSGHAGGGGEHAVGANEIAALSDAFARKSHRIVIVAAEELGVGGDPVIAPIMDRAGSGATIARGQVAF
jgi:hypothetical protein